MKYAMLNDDAYPSAGKLNAAKLLEIIFPMVNDENQQKLRTHMLCVCAQKTER